MDTLKNFKIFCACLFLLACSESNKERPKRMSYFPPPENQPEFICAKEKDNNPPLDPELEARYQEIRAEEKQTHNADWQKLNYQYRLLAEQGHWKAASRLAYRHIKAIGGPRNYREAFKWYRHLANQHIPKGYYNLAVMAEKGLAVEQDKEKAWAYLHRAAQLGSPHAQHRLGEIYLYPRNDDRMGELYHRCALSQGYAKSARALGHLGLVQDNYPKAMYFTQMAASMGLSISMLKLNTVFELGQYGYDKEIELAKNYEKLYSLMAEDETITFPDLLDTHPLPPHPTMGLYNPETDQNEIPEGK